MSVMCCRVPDFLMGLAERRQPDLAGKPVALLGADERVWAASLEARQSGVTLQMNARQARMRCADVHLQPLDTETAQAEQGAFLGTLAECGLPVESPAWGLAYVDLHAVADSSQAVRPYCADLGKQVRGALGEPLVPSIGWDMGKFTARAAASHATPGHMRLVDRSNEARFLQPLSIELLPLSPLVLQQLDWLGIRTLGQFARLPTTAIWQRFGAEGKLAQKWAQGHDDRPVRPTVEENAPPLTIDFDPPTGLHGPVLEAILAKLRPTLSTLAKRLEGCRHLRFDLRFAETRTRAMDCAFVEPVSDESRVKAILSHQLQVLNWPAELSSVKIALLEIGELVPRQLTLFPMDAGRSPLVQLAQKLSSRYTNIFFQPRLDDAQHPLPERRVVWNALAAPHGL
ncbi:MAG: hypothetical protein HY782_21805 [Chloroflexi bacterium]|nr:hypothetical protein [Chloroflexota bacterium]